MPYIPADARAARPKTVEWVYPTLTGATNVGGGYQLTRYAKINGWVFVEGWVTVSNTTLTTMFTLPAGYRPALHRALTVGKLAGGVYGSSGFEVLSTGAVRYPSGLTAGNALYLNSIMFPAEA